MNPGPLDVSAHTDVPSLCHYRWLPTLAVQPGMVIARPVVGLAGVLETMYLAIGSTITVSTIAQIVVKGVECVAVFDPSVPDLIEDDRSAVSFEARLRAIFGPYPDPACQALMNALILARPTLC